MYTENRWHDAKLFVKAVLSNQLARFSPGVYVRLTGQTGRGKNDTDPAGVADYFMRCFQDYRRKLGHADEASFAEYLAGKRVLEYGPGDVLGVALLFYAWGAERVDCVDRFPLSRIRRSSIEIYQHLLRKLDGIQRQRAESVFEKAGDPASGLDESRISYHVDPAGLSRMTDEYDLILSRAVLEHVSDLEASFRDMHRALRNTGISLHLVDLKSHGLDRYKEFDFLTWPEWAYRLMYSHKGFPNRWRVDRYETLAREQGFRITLMEPTECIAESDLRVIVDDVPVNYKSLPMEKLSWKGFWMRLEK